MKKSLLIFILFFGCTSTSNTPKTTQGSNPYEVSVPKGKMILVDMGYVEGTINNKKIHAYRIAYHTGIGVTNDHIYVIENNDQINIVQSEGKTMKHIKVIVDSDTFEVQK